MTDRRAQSEVLGFILVFSVIVASTGIVYTVGFSALEDARTAEQLNNMERAYDILDDNVRDVSQRGAPARATELDLGGGGLRLGEEVNITVTATNTTNASDSISISRTTRPLVYTLDDRSVVYASGATIRENRDGSVITSEPEWVFGGQRAILGLVTARAGGEREAIGGQTSVLVRTQALNRGTDTFTTGSGSKANVTIRVESPRAEAWGQYFERQGLDPVDGDPTDGDVSYEFETETAYLQFTTTTVEFEL